MDVEATYFGGQDEHHLYPRHLEDLTTLQGMRHAGLQGVDVDLGAVAALDLEKPLLLLRVEVYDGM